MTGSERTIFIEALDRDDPAERAAFLDRACGDQLELRRRVERLLEAIDSAGSFMESPAAPSGIEPIDGGLAPILERPGTRIGPYKLLEPIGEGGMGVVYMAEQAEPMRRKVALKIIKPGMDSAQVIARFEAERQALAMMDHPNIAKVLDAGATDTGRPYFVMELVRGVPITEYCDRERLSLAERLELFAPVCRAIQHAHQKGIIHRDIKPSNVMVTLYDGRPVPKVIDFGVAKAIDQPLTERTLFTRFGAIVGTLEYMSPEQAELGALDVDTRSDVYSLGVLLYELLTGSTPLERARLREAGYSEILRKIREEDPPRPSARLSGSRDALPTISEQRRVEPVRLPKLVRGELDWIVMKALEKDRSRRYESASGLALDIERHLQHEAVEAGPPSAAYRFRKRVQRITRGRRAPIAAVFLLLLLVGAAGGFILMVQQARARQVIAMLAERRAMEAARFQAEAARQEAAQRRAPESQAVLEFFNQNLFAAPAGGGTSSPFANLERAEAALKSFPFKDTRVEASIRAALGRRYLAAGLTKRAVRQLELALIQQRRDLGHDDRETLRTMSDLADAQLADGDVEEALSLHGEALSRGKPKLGGDSPEVLSFMNNLGRAYLATEPAAAEPILRDALAGWMRKDHDDWHTFEAATLLGRFLLIRKDYPTAESYLLQGYEGLRSREARIPDISRRRIAEARARIVELYEAWGKPEKAEEWRRKAAQETTATPKKE